MELPKPLLKDIEVAFISELIRQLRAGEQTEAQAKAVTRLFLGLYPFRTLQDTREKIDHFVVVHPAFAELKLTLAHYEDYSRTQDVLEKMRKHMKAGKLDEAIGAAT
jgi:hypothetical protein